MIKLIITDLDGTLLNDEKHIPKENIIALREAMSKGIHVSVATGRNFHSAKRYIEELGLDVPVIFQNGAFIYQWMEDKVLYRSDLKAQIAQEVIETARKYGIFYILYIDFLSEKDMYIDKDYEGEFLNYLEQNKWRINYVDDVIKYLYAKEHVAEVALVGDEEKIKKVINESLKGFENETSVVKNNKIISETFYEIFGPNSSKEESFEFLLKHFNVKPEETMYLGDSYNDIGMLKRVGFPVVMENAHSDVKIYGKYVTKSNNEAGVAYVVKKLVLGSEEE
ncbi:MAG: HAD family hydrolase [Fervidobacterium sp.]